MGLHFAQCSAVWKGKTFKLKSCLTSQFITSHICRIHEVWFYWYHVKISFANVKSRQFWIKNWQLKKFLPFMIFFSNVLVFFGHFMTLLFYFIFFSDNLPMLIKVKSLRLSFCCLEISLIIGNSLLVCLLVVNKINWSLVLTKWWFSLFFFFPSFYCLYYLN